MWQGNLPAAIAHKGVFFMSTDVNKVAARRFYEEIINQKQLAVVDEVVANNIINHDFPASLPLGSAGIKIFLGAFHTAFPDGHVTIDQMIAEGDTVATRLTFRGTHTGQFQGIAPTGRAVTIPGIAVARFVDGKIVEHWGGPNRFSLLQQLGVLPFS
jgi:steroid delta-isomerase-like uncharacterized protein